MANSINSAKMGWTQTNSGISSPRGNMLLVSCVIKRDGTQQSLGATKTRCIWPSAWDNQDSRYISRRIQAKA